MTLPAGTQLGPYEIVEPLGAGGMGEVYRARDTRLDRDVAVKVLPKHLAGDAQLRQRLEREAKAVSSLSHPHICALYDIGHQEGIDFLVMEYLVGETLAARLEKGPLPVDEAVRIAIEIADALNQAHKQGVMHRDLKPGNVMLTRGAAKLLDFGLAKSAAPDTPAGAMTAVPTMVSPLTVEGMMVGTFQYMAPEQLEGSEATTRSDIFAFGAVLYEMLTGSRPFAGKTQASLVAAILKEQPRPLSMLQPAVPPALERLVATCLEKDPEERRQSMHDVLIELRWIKKEMDAGGAAAGGGWSGAASAAAGAAAAPGSQPGMAGTSPGSAPGAFGVATTPGTAPGTPGPAATQPPGRGRLSWSILFVVALAAVAALTVAIMQSIPSGQPPVMHVNLALPEGNGFAGNSGPMAVSPDGKSVAFIAINQDGQQHLWVRRLDRPAATRLDDTLGAEYPFWSPDGRHLGFFAARALKRIAAAGGPADRVCDSSGGTNGRGGSWNADGTILFSTGWGSPIYRVVASGGEPEMVTKLSEEQADHHRLPQMLPDGQHFLFSMRRGADYNAVALGNLDGTNRELMKIDSNAVYVPPGYVLYWRESALRARPFDADTFQFTGEPFLVASGVYMDPADGAGMFSASPGGVLAYMTGEAVTEQSRLVLRDRTGKEIGQVGPPGNYYSPRFSPDGTSVAVDRSGVANNGDIWRYEIDRPVGTRLTTDPVNESAPILSPDGRRLVFLSYARGNADLYVLDLVSGGAPEMIVAHESHDNPTDWSEDGRYIFIDREPHRNRGNRDIWVYDSESGEARALVAGDFEEWAGDLSPDGRWLAYTSDESGQPEIYLRPFPEGTDRRQVSVGGGEVPRWRRDGKELFYVTPQGEVAVASFEVSAPDASDTPELHIGRPEILFPASLRFASGDQYDVSADGQTFVISTPLQTSVSRPISLMLNWRPGEGR